MKTPLSRENKLLRKILLVVAALPIVLWSCGALAQVALPTLNLGFKNADSPDEVVSVIKLVIILTILTLAPAILILMTSFTRIIIVFSFLRQAIGVQQMPPNQLLVGLALFLTLFVMAPVFEKMNTEAIRPYLSGSMKQEVALEKALLPLRGFMFNQTRPDDLSLFLKLGRVLETKTRADVPTTVLIPAFIISEVKTAFMIGFVIFLPFLIIDIVVASVLMAMGMMMLPPVIVALPFKILIFILVDGWSLLVGSVVKSFG